MRVRDALFVVAMGLAIGGVLTVILSSAAASWLAPQEQRR